MRGTAFLFFILAAFLISLSGPVKAESISAPETQQIYLPAPLVSQLSTDGKAMFNGVPVKAVVADPNPSAPRRKIPAPAALATTPEAATASFSITYVPNGGTDAWGEPCYTFPESAKTAFNAAASIWANTLTSAMPITIQACWADLGSSTTLGYSGGGSLYRDFTGAPRANTWYGASLANALSGSDMGPGLFDMHITYNQNFTWYYGTDGNTPLGQYDLMTVVLHEIAHGLNFSGSMQYSGGIGSWGYGTGYPNIYDVFMRDGAGTQLVNTGTYPNGSAALGSALVSDNIWFHGSEAMAANGSQRVKMYAPTTWSDGSSYSHLDYSTFNNTANQLMVFAVSDGESVHDPGAITKGLFKDLGWTLSVPPSPAWVSATDGTYTDKIRLTWAAVSGATSYNVYYAESLTGTKYYINSTADTVMDFVGATPEYVYYFWVSASNQGGEGVLSNYDTGYMAGIYYIVSASKSGTGSGTVSSSPAGISCGADCSENYLAGTSVTLSASANSGSKAAWNDCAAQGGVVSGNNTTLATCTFSSLDANKTVTATFTLNTYTVTPSPGTNGSMSPSTPQIVNYNETMVFTVTPDNGYFIDTVTGCSGSLDGEIFTTGPITSDCEVVATFSLGGYTVTPLAGANGSISPSTPQVVNHGLTTSFTVTPEVNYHVGSVTGCGGSMVGDIYTTGQIMGDCSVSASFAISTYELTVTITGKGKGLVTSEPIGISCNDDCTELYDSGTLVTLTATPQGGAIFVGWSGDCTGADSTCDVTVDQARNVSAEFISSFPWTMFLPAITNNATP